MTTEWVVDVKGVTKSFDHRVVVNHVDIKIKKGEVFGFLGPNGSGKTTMMRMLCGLMKADSGTGHCLGYDFNKESSNIKMHVGYMPQYFSYYHELTVEDNLKFIAKLYGYQDVDAYVYSLCERFGLLSYRHVLAGHLSGGWKQRLSLAAAMLNKPKLLLLDEPTAGVDPEARRYFWEEIHTIAKEGATVFVSTHLMDEATRCDRLLCMVYGKKVAEGSQDELIEKSGVLVFEVQEDIDHVQSVINSQFPEVTVSVLSGRLRVSFAKKQQDVLYWVETSPFMFEPVKPNIEEIFVYYSSDRYV